LQSGFIFASARNHFVTSAKHPSQREGALPRAEGRFVSHVAALIAGNGLAQAINIAGTLGLAWLLTPADYGVFALFAAIVSFLSVLGGARYELAIMLPDEDQEAANVLTLATLVMFGISIVFLILVAAFSAPLGSFFGNPDLRHWLWSMPLALLINGTYHTLGYWSGRMKRFADVARSRVYQSLGVVGGQLILLLAFENGGTALIGGWIFGLSLGVGFLMAQIARSEGAFLVRAHDWSVVREAAGKYKNFPLYKAPYSFVSNAAAQCVPMVLQVFSNLGVLGFYSMAHRTVYLPVNLIASAMNQVFYEKAATELRYGRLEEFVTRILRIQIVLATPILVLFTFDAPLLFTSLLGEKWGGAGIYAAMLAWVAYLSFLASWLDRLYDVRGRQKLSLFLTAVRTVCTLGGLFITLWYTRDTVLAVGVYSGLQALYIVIYLCMAYRVAEFRLHSLFLVAKDALKSGVFAILVVGLIHTVFSPPYAMYLSVAAIGLMALIYFYRYVPGGHAFASPASRFQHLWNEKISRNRNIGLSRSQVEELEKLFAHRRPRRMLEIGCGEGTLFSSLEVPLTRYKGVDFCRRRINAFHSRHPEAELECAEGASYVEADALYDLIVLNGMVQHCDPHMLRAHLKNARVMMHGDSLLIWTSVPNRRHRRNYDLGLCSGSTAPSRARWCKSWLHRLLGLDLMGHWYGPDDIAQLASEEGFMCEVINSAVSSYRFHVLMRPNLGSRPLTN
jgi:O-antigen/teichoic acid export membrane protein/SAM-dependent methyltransferase